MTGTVEQLWRYPVKSVLGERLTTSEVTGRGLTGDRCLALRHRETGRVASAKHPRLWRDLLTLHASGAGPETVRIALPDGRVLDAADPDTGEALARLLGQPVDLIRAAPPGAVLDRAHPDEVLAAGVTADVPVDETPLAGAAPGTFFDFAPVHLVTTSTLDALAAATPGAGPEAVRYRPNLVLRTTGEGFPENDWVGRDLYVGAELVLRVLVPTPRCAVPTLAHGDLPRQLDALRVPARVNRVVPLPQLGPQPCVGAYAQVIRPGRVAVGDPVRVG